MIDRLLLLGASGDLAGRYLLPALAAAAAAGRLPDGFTLVGAAPEEWDDEGFRRQAEDDLRRHAGAVPAAAREAVLRSLAYRRVDLNDASTVSDAVEAAAGPDRAALAAYLALPPALFSPAIEALAQSGLPDGSRIAMEKPFGDDAGSAQALNALLARTVADAEKRVFRVDHMLGLPAVQNLVALRLLNRVLEAVWTGEHVESVEVVWDETLALEGRAGYYDGAGALKDMLQSHLLQILALIAMEPPAGEGERELHDAKVEVLRALQADPGRSRRARYGAGRIGDRAVPAYAEEAGVDPGRCTETYAEVALTLDNPRWRGTGFLLRAGKALGEDRAEVVVRFRPPDRDAADPARSELRIGLGEPDAVELRLAGAVPGPPPRPAPLSLRAPTPSSELPAYGHVLLDILSGGTSLSVRGDEAEDAWRVVAPVLEAWDDGRVPLEEYAAGSSGPGEVRGNTATLAG